MVLKEVGKVQKLYISQKVNKQRVTKDKICVDVGGVIDDKFFQKDDKREVLLASIDSYKLAKDNAIELSYGDLGENILMDFNPYKLEVGTQLQIGTAIFEISLYCPICNHLSKVKKELPKLLKNDRGIFAKVIKRGKILKDDKVYLI
jgi:MOSC domain-containing protein YiiM